MNLKDVIIYFGFPFTVLIMGIVFKIIIGKITKLLEDKENRIFNELSKLTAKNEALYNLIMEMKAELPKGYASKDELNRLDDKNSESHEKLRVETQELGKEIYKKKA